MDRSNRFLCNSMICISLLKWWLSIIIGNFILKGYSIVLQIHRQNYINENITKQMKKKKIYSYLISKVTNLTWTIIHEVYWTKIKFIEIGKMVGRMQPWVQENKRRNGTSLSGHFLFLYITSWWSVRYCFPDIHSTDF